MNRTEITEAVARGWCSPENSHKVMDEQLAMAIVDEVNALDGSPHLGLATTREILDELRCRIEIDYYAGGGGLDYSTVKGRPIGTLNG